VGFTHSWSECGSKDCVTTQNLMIQTMLRLGFHGYDNENEKLCSKIQFPLSASREICFVIFFISAEAQCKQYVIFTKLAHFNLINSPHLV
jgi:hypothetical protein